MSTSLLSIRKDNQLRAYLMLIASAAYRGHCTSRGAATACIKSRQRLFAFIFKASRIAPLEVFVYRIKTVRSLLAYFLLLKNDDDVRIGSIGVEHQCRGNVFSCCVF